MARPSKYSSEQIVAAAKSLVFEGGVSALTMTAVANKMGAPSGSVYHRFSSRDELVAEIWLASVERFQNDLLGLVTGHEHSSDPVERAVLAARSVIDWVGAHPEDATILTWYRREELMADDVRADLSDRAARASLQLDRALGDLARELSVPTEMVALAVAGFPLAALKRPIAEGRAPSSWLPDAIERAVRGLLAT